MEQPGTSTPLMGAVQELATQVVSALTSGGHSRVSAGTAVTIGDDDLGLAAVRVLGADVLLPSVLYRRPPAPVDLAVCEKAVLAYPPAPDASATSRWTHWAMTRTLRDLGASAAVESPDGAEPDATWLEDLPWQALTHQLALLAALAVPAAGSTAHSTAGSMADCAVAHVAGRRVVDVARGFVRAVRRRGWQQAAGAGRWLAVLDGVPDTLGLDAGLEFVAQMGGDDPRVALHLHAARHARAGAPG
ncbi:hypothetical protein AMK26_18885 [Streptomyces sp. CB03234]|uniref:hypothetical protein n=1 Tax=Streptomyces sp. (strain CB03234) TaxID=1703937 RepID=UPI00093D1633|nr:hypothetical protein [Streptomyces sp. CB03234]OKK03543.1 hypothetical protein AMK26_18885 [Streptomyces sp. CB03234]